MNAMDSNPQAGVLDEARKALRCLYIAVDKSIADTVSQKCEAAFDLLAKQAQSPTGQGGEVEGLLREADDIVRFHQPLGHTRESKFIERLAAALRAQGAGEPTEQAQEVFNFLDANAGRRFQRFVEERLNRASGSTVYAAEASWTACLDWCIKCFKNAYAHPVSQPPSGQEKP